ncbi:hypothetical protein NW762_012612 [Fusarium torreyae]|uniref:Major facilitator superfamily (MFS) profile domain-containing protein n=1 Tax=Fusarium torreyae TaxID=1237075 RepID=A0A9W8VBA5_9HYPO|nr:hypothetical protein NW762_012612 [Fusarium torreyae]
MLGKVDSGADSIHVEKPLDAQHKKAAPDAVVTEAERNRILRRIDLRVVPILTVLYLLSFLDRGSIGNANILGLSEDLGLHPSQYNWCLTVFFFPYSFLEPICNLLLVRFKPSRWLPSIMVLWVPGIAFYMSLWYPRENAQLRLSIVFAAASMAGAFSGLLAYLIDKMDGVGNLEGWRWIFILEGLLTFIVAVAAYGLVQDEPATCKFLSDDDKRVLFTLIHNVTVDDNTTVEDAPATTLGNEGNASRWTHAIAALKDWQTIFHCINYWGMAVAVYALSLFLPQIINGLGYTAQIAQLLTIPVYAAATITTVVMGYFADKTGGRSVYILVCYVVVFVGFLMAVAPSAFIPGLTYAGCFIAACGIYPSLPGLLALASNNYAPNTKRAVGMAVQIGFGTMGGAAASNFYRKADAPRYRLGHGLVLAFVSLGLIMVSTYYVICRRVNKRRESQGSAAQILTQEDLATKGDKALGFRYKL